MDVEGGGSPAGGATLAQDDDDIIIARSKRQRAGEQSDAEGSSGACTLEGLCASSASCTPPSAHPSAPPPFLTPHPVPPAEGDAPRAPDASGAESDASDASSPAEKGDASDASASDDGFVRRKRPGKKPKKPRAAAKPKAAAGGPAKKRKRKTYVEEAAEVAGDEEDEDDDEGYAALRKAGITRDEYQAKVIEQYEKENRALQAKRANERTAEEIAAGIEAKYQAGGYAYGDEEVELGGALAAQANLPGMRDPKLWLLRCKEGSELAILIALLNKYVAKAETGEKLGIMSAATTSKGVIFVEAYRDAQVRQAVAGITDLYGWKPDAIMLVPLAQMTAALHVSASRDVYKRGMFVRYGRGTYKGDLGQVVEVLEGGSKLLVKAVPRINYKALALPPAKRKVAGRKAGPRPPQRFYDRKEYVDHSGGDADILNVLKWGMRVDKIGTNYYSSDGLTYKEMKADHVTAHGPAPSMEEVSQFKAKRDEGEDGKLSAEHQERSAEESLLDSLRNVRSNNVELTLEPGDSIVVVKGDLAGLTGHVVVVNPGGTFTLMPSAESTQALGISEKLEIPMEEAAKTFDIGDHVKVLGGVFRGETGTVLASRAVSDESDAESVPVFIATLLLDSGQKTVDVFVKDLSKTTEVVTSVTSVDGYELHDLVEIKGITENKPDAGCVVQLGQREISVLLTTGQIQKIPVQEIRGKANYRGATGMAVSQGVPLSVGDVVRVIQGAPGVLNLTGTIKHIYGMRLFLHSFAFQDNAGIFVVRPQQVVLASRRNAAAEQKVQVMTTVGRVLGRPRPGQNSSLGRTVRIIKGRWKSRIGMIRNETETHYSVELHQAQQKHVTLLKEECSVIGDEHGATGGAPAPAQFLLGGGATPHLGGATPSFGGGMTPGMMGGATPMFGGGATPMFGGKTPFAGGTVRAMRWGKVYPPCTFTRAASAVRPQDSSATCLPPSSTSPPSCRRPCTVRVARRPCTARGARRPCTAAGGRRPSSGAAWVAGRPCRAAAGGRRCCTAAACSRCPTSASSSGPPLCAPPSPRACCQTQTSCGLRRACA